MLKRQPRRGQRYMKSRPGLKRKAEYAERESFYCRPALNSSIGEQAEAEQESKSSIIMSGILEVVLISDVGQCLPRNARKKAIPLRQELEQVLNSFLVKVPSEKIEQCASSSQRTTEQMITFLILIGLDEYEKNARM